MLQEDVAAHDSAAAELVAEEEKAAAKAAAKKAKKQRQKLKATKQAQPEQASASVTESRGAPIPSGQAHPLSPESAQLSMDLPELSSSSGQHQAEGPQTNDLNQQQQQQQHEAEGTSLSASSAVGAAAAQENNAKAVAVELEALHLASCDQAANKGQKDSDFLQQLFCCPLTKVSHEVAICTERQVRICSVAMVQQQMQCLGSWL